MITFDGQKYEKKSDIPDFGSITFINAVEGRREYRGLKKDYDLLPKYDDLETGSSCLFVDTGEYAEYLAHTKRWYLI